MNEIEGGARTLNVFTTPWFQVTIYQILRPLFSILDTTILTDFRLHACTVTIIYYQFRKNNIKLLYCLFL